MFRVILLCLCLACTHVFALKVKIGTSTDDTPLSSLAKGKDNFYGFEIDIMMEICKRIKVVCEFVPMVASDLKADLDNKYIDLAIAAIIIPPKDTHPDLTFSLPYLPSSIQYITNVQSKINTLQDIKNKTLGVRLGSLYGRTLLADFALNMYDSKVKIEFFLTMDDLLAALKSGKIDAALSNSQPIQYWYVNNEKQFKLVGDPLPIGRGYGIVGRKEQMELMKEINKALLKMEDDGTYTSIYSRYFTL